MTRNTTKTAAVAVGIMLFGDGFDPIRLLEALGHKVAVHDAWGSAQSIFRENGVLMGAADTRQWGTLATGY